MRRKEKGAGEKNRINLLEKVGEVGLSWWREIHDEKGEKTGSFVRGKRILSRF